MAMKLYSFPVFKTVYGLCYILADNEKAAYEKWQQYDSADESCYDFSDSDSEISSACNWRECEEERACPSGIVPLGGTMEEYRECLINRCNDLQNEINSIAAVLERLEVTE